MPIEKVTILDGTRPGDKNLEPFLAVLKDQLKRTGAEVHTFTLREIKLAHCIGCFGCWVETPGLCVEADAGLEIAKTVSHSQTLILFTPITFGGYSSELKRMVDRLVPWRFLISPYSTARFITTRDIQPPRAWWALAFNITPTVRKQRYSKPWLDAMRSTFILQVMAQKSLGTQILPRPCVNGSRTRCRDRKPRPSPSES